MKLFSLTFMLALILPAMTFAQSGKVSFAGNWVLNTEKSTMSQNGGYQRMGGGNFSVTQEANLLTRSRTGQDGTTRVTKYTLDGKESINTSGRGDSKSTVKWSSDGKTLTIVSKINFDGNERTVTEEWTLVDPKTLSIVSTREGQNGEVKNTMIFDKQ
jgi:Tol biopolymer transport system component